MSIRQMAAIWAAFLATATAWADRPEPKTKPPMPTPKPPKSQVMALALCPSVQSETKIEPEAANKAMLEFLDAFGKVKLEKDDSGKAYEKYRTEMRRLEREACEKHFGKDATDRAFEIYFQLALHHRIYVCLDDVDLVKQLEFEDVAKTREQHHKMVLAAYQEGGDKKTQEDYKRIQAELIEKFKKEILTAEQREKLEEIKGKPVADLDVIQRELVVKMRELASKPLPPPPPPEKKDDPKSPE